MTSGDFWSFAALSTVLALTPGPDTMLVLRNAVAGGVRGGLATTFGVKGGTLTHSALAAAGVAALLLKLPMFYSAMKLLGAAYLVCLGLYGLYRALVSGQGSTDGEAAKPAKGDWRCFAEGYVSNITNPKVVVFYVAVLPQFVAPGDPVFLTTAKLASVHVGISFVWLVGVSLFAGAARRWLTKPGVRKGVDATSGLAIALFGVRLALSHR